MFERVQFLIDETTAWRSSPFEPVRFSCKGGSTADAVVLAGGSGFLRKLLAGHLSKCGYRVVVLSSSAGAWCGELQDAAAVINLTGKSGNCRYTPDNRRKILESRLDSVRVLESAIAKCQDRLRVFIQTASLAIYGDAGVRFAPKTHRKPADFREGFLFQFP